MPFTMLMLTATLLGDSPLALPAVTLQDEAAQTVRLDALKGQPVVLTMGYTACKTRCPMTLQAMKRVEAAFEAAGQPVQLVIITLDPHNDSPEKLRATHAAKGLGPRWHFYVASDAQTDALAQALSLKVARDDEHIDHDARIFVFDAQGKLARTYLGWKFDPAEPVRLLATTGQP
jgi:protein SCO1/2